MQSYRNRVNISSNTIFSGKRKLSTINPESVDESDIKKTLQTYNKLRIEIDETDYMINYNSILFINFYSSVSNLHTEQEQSFRAIALEYCDYLKKINKETETLVELLSYLHRTCNNYDNKYKKLSYIKFVVSMYKKINPNMNSDLIVESYNKNVNLYIQKNYNNPNPIIQQEIQSNKDNLDFLISINNLSKNHNNNNSYEHMITTIEQLQKTMQSHKFIILDMMIKLDCLYKNSNSYSNFSKEIARVTVDSIVTNIKNGIKDII